MLMSPTRSAAGSRPLADRTGTPVLPWTSRLLPRVFREQVIVPAYADLLLEEGRIRGFRRLFSRGAFVVECLRLGLPAWLWWQGRPTRLFGGIAAGVVVFALLIWIVATNVSYG